MRSEVLFVEGEPAGWQKFYSGTHWSKRSNIAHDVHWLVKVAVMAHKPIDPFAGRVDIVCVGYYSGKRDDPDNLCDKLYIDGLRHAGVIKNDSAVYIRYTATRAELDNARPRVEIIIKEVEE